MSQPHGTPNKELVKNASSRVCVDVSKGLYIPCVQSFPKITMAPYCSRLTALMSIDAGRKPWLLMLLVDRYLGVDLTGLVLKTIKRLARDKSAVPNPEP